MSDDPVKTMADATLDWFEGALREEAACVDRAVENAPQLVSTVFRNGEGSDAAKLPASELPTMARAIKIGKYAVVIGLLPENSSGEAVNEALRRYRNQCVVARSYLKPIEALDLQLFLIGPRGSERVNDWQTAALIVERDEKVARKLTWLRPEYPGADKKSFKEFTKRTFLARPWIDDAIFTMAALDNISQPAAIGEIPRTTAEEWVKLAQTEKEEALVNGLIAAWARRGSV